MEVWENGTDFTRNEANESMCKSSLLKEKNYDIKLRNGNLFDRVFKLVA